MLPIDRIIRSRRVRLLGKYEFLRLSDCLPLVRGGTDWVFVDLKSRRPRPLPEEVIRLFGFS